MTPGPAENNRTTRAYRPDWSGRELVGLWAKNRQPGFEHLPRRATMGVTYTKRPGVCLECRRRVRVCQDSKLCIGCRTRHNLPDSPSPVERFDAVPAAKREHRVADAA